MTLGSPRLAEADLIVTPDEAAEYMKVGLDQPSRKQILMQLIMLQGTLERNLNRPVTIRQFQQTKRIDEFGDVRLRWGPIQSIDAVKVNDVDTEPSSVFDTTFELSNNLAYGTVLDVTYTAGGCDEMEEDVRGVILTSLARWQIQGLQVSTGAIQNYSVEGLRVQYTLRGTGSRAANGKGALGFTADELDCVSRLRRRVLVR
jgi:hypothetical protein